MERSIACNTPEAEADAVTGSLHAIDALVLQGMTWHDHRFGR
jgi:hypothetical protein